jgi:hypothetical protein
MLVCSVGWDIILTNAFYGFPQTVQANAEIAPQLGHELFLLNPMQFIIQFSCL